jgi:hypothetical protein
VEIFYCIRCGTRVTEGEIDEGFALAFAQGVVCEPCVNKNEDLKRLRTEQTHTVRTEAKNEIIARRHTKKRRAPTGTLKAARNARSSSTGYAIAGVLVGVAAMMVVVLATSGGGRRKERAAPSRAMRASSHDVAGEDVYLSIDPVETAPEPNASPTDAPMGRDAVPPSGERPTSAEAHDAAAGESVPRCAIGETDGAKAAPRAESHAATMKALLKRGVAFAENEDADAAEHAFREAIRLNEEYAVPHTNLGAILVERGRWEEAEGHLCRAIELDPLLGEAHLNLGMLREAQWRDVESAQLIEAGLRRAPERAEAVNAQL